MRATLVGDFDPARRSESKTLFIIHDRVKLAELGTHLRVDEGMLEQQISLMTQGDLQLNFLSGHALLTSVSYIFADFLRWKQGGPDARLVNPLALVRSLVDAGWESPLAQMAIELLSKRRANATESP